MVKRNTNYTFNFYCMTENPTNLRTEILIKPLPNKKLLGWWMKPYVFSKENEFLGDVLFLDLDLIVHDNFDKLWQYSPNDFCIIRDFSRKTNPGYQKFNSSVFRFRARDYHWIWEDFINDYKKITTKNHGDQDYLYHILKGRVTTWPDSWIQSYKWEIRDRSELKVLNGRRNFATIKNPNIPKDCCIAVFHGEPNPPDVKDPWVIENWK